MSKDLLVVGNGLDEGLGYHTSYKYLYKYLKDESQTNRDVNKKFNNVNKLFSFSQPNSVLWVNFEDKLGDLSFDSLSDNGVDRLQGLGSKLWDNIKFLFRLWTSKKIYPQINNQEPCFSHREPKRISTLINNASLILSFNYTPTIENYFSKKSSEILHIHGNCQCPIIGHYFRNNITYKQLMKSKPDEGDNNKLPGNTSYVEETRSSLGKETEKYKDKYSIKNTHNIYECNRHNSKNKEWFNTLKNINSITFFGISYSKVDRNYYKYLNKDYFNGRYIKPIFYYHSDDNKECAKKFADYLVTIKLVRRNSVNDKNFKRI